ncbi:uncharacterized protein LOC111708207 [Eurytemora carolleeae]|uniref:uncharacterized protein LOC111708207 n=1 Tax=Eurytemora carolleeae TaxID=1294199 RepID=UPI000C7878FC|nr:uncharacterized protein LOC111708207 [Eurytemora carolleeae]|eukprot:XP_023337279.1 uncharacterized protein LOC111708207 [Eurytemora affinis]
MVQDAQVRRINTGLLRLMSTGILEFMRKTVWDRVYREFHTGLITERVEKKCSGYLKDRSVSIRFMQPLGKPKPLDQTIVLDFKPNQQKLSLNHLAFAFMLLAGNSFFQSFHQNYSSLFPLSSLTIP